MPGRQHAGPCYSDLRASTGSLLLAELAGTYSTSNFIFLFVIFLLIVKLFHMTIKQSQMETRLRELVQKMAIDEKEERDRAKEKED